MKHRKKKNRQKFDVHTMRKGIIVLILIGLFIGLSYTNQLPIYQDDLEERIEATGIPNIKDTDIEYVAQEEEKAGRALTDEEIQNAIERYRAEVVTSELP